MTARSRFACIFCGAQLVCVQRGRFACCRIRLSYWNTTVPAARAVQVNFYRVMSVPKR